MGVFPTKILVAIDGSEEARLATQAATELSRDTGSELHVLYVLPTPAQLIGHHLYPKETQEAVVAEAEGRAREFLEEQSQRIGSEGGKVSETHFRSGEPDKEILRAAEEIEAGTIVVGSRGLGAISRTLLGSVSDSVVRHAHCPVFVVRS